MTLLRVARNVAMLERAVAFHQALGFELDADIVEDPALATWLGVTRIRRQFLRLGSQQLELTQCYPAGASYPEQASSNDLLFQHIAIITHDIGHATARAISAGAVPISQNGPQQLPLSSGGMKAFKFRDIDRHPLEFLEAQDLPIGYDHSAISVSDVDRSVAFYAGHGFTEAKRQLNTGPEQERLDHLADVAVDVVTLKAGPAAPHLELLSYRNPSGSFASMAMNDIAADRLILRTTENAYSLSRDPDGHIILA